ncbi:MAG: cysteine--tRNA ligase [Propionibacteriaceae bacterium]|jgi:cysteinyl-tRNA synthetase|nr:cysteine--tRNA ligase [Propionibacteriaceae bacterium]
MSLVLHDTARSAKIPFEPLVPGQVSIYCCGMTVQGPPHLGHVRKEMVFDVLRRWLTACGFEVRLVTNVTDIDDKILAKAEQAGVPWWAWAYAQERELHRALAAIGLTPPTYEPRATGHIPEMLALIEQLLAAGHAYVASDGSGDVYFDVRSWPKYGSLSGQRLDEMEAAVDADPRGKRDPRDFALWKGAKPGEPETASWAAPWGRGRPGWHLECSAMAGKYLGDSFDIHGGGIDLKFPHHENEMAQSQAAGRPFARYWMHNAWVTAAGEKMSKSLGNGMLVTAVVGRWSGRAVRLYLAGPHYRSTIEFSDAALDEASVALARVDSFVERATTFLDQSAAGVSVTASELGSNSEDSVAALAAESTGLAGLIGVPQAFADALDDDLGTPAALAVLYDTVRAGNRALEALDRPMVAQALSQVSRMLDIFGLNLADTAWVDQQAGDDLAPVVDGLVSTLLAQRAAARAAKDFATADAIRDSLTGLGLTIEDTAQGARWTR